VNFIIIIIIIILFAIKSMIYKTHGQKQYDRTTRHTSAFRRRPGKWQLVRDVLVVNFEQEVKCDFH